MMRTYKDAWVAGLGRDSYLMVFSLVLILCAGVQLRAQNVVVQDGKTSPVAAPPAGDEETNALAAKEEPAAAKPLAPTEITSDTLEYDFTKQVITFTGNVHVVDDQLDLQAKKMHVTLNQKTQTVTHIAAVGDVQVKKEGGRASGEKATYDLVKGAIILTGKPVIHHPQGNIEGALRVIYERQKGKFRTEGGQPKLRIKGRQGNDAVKDFISGAGGDDDLDDAPKDKTEEPATDTPAPPATDMTPETDPKPDVE